MGSRSRHGSGASSSGERMDPPDLPPSMEQTLILILRKLKEKRRENQRPEDIEVRIFFTARICGLAMLLMLIISASIYWNKKPKQMGIPMGNNNNYKRFIESKLLDNIHIFKVKNGYLWIWIISENFPSFYKPKFILCMYNHLQLMNRDQVQEEKLAVQKALLHFESIHGRPVSSDELLLIKRTYNTILHCSLYFTIMMKMSNHCV